MIVQDATENRKGSRFHLDFPTSSILEKVTGADFLISPANFPATTEALIQRHVAGGAMLVQRKSLRDLVESCRGDGGIKASLARMHTVGAAWWQCVVLASGIFLPNVKRGTVKVGMPTLHANGRITFTWQKTTVQYKTFVTAKRRFPLRGGWIDIVSCDEEIPGWLRHAEKDLQLLGAQPVRELYPELEKFPPDSVEPFQEVREITDARTVIAAFHGIGKIKASALWDAIRAWNKAHFTKNWTPTLSQLLVWATMEDPGYHGCPAVPFWGPKTRASVRAQFPLGPGQSLQISTYESKGENSEHE